MNCSLPVSVDWFDLWEKLFPDDGTSFIPVSCTTFSSSMAEEAIDIQPQTKLPANHQEQLALKLDIMLNSVFPTSSTEFLKKQSTAKVLENHHLEKNYNPTALRNWDQIQLFEYICTWNSYASTWKVTESGLSHLGWFPRLLAELGFLELQTRMLCTLWFAWGCQNPSPATDT